MLTDLFVDNQGASIPSKHLCSALSEVCVPLAGRCIYRLKLGDESVQSTDMLMIEYELCIGLIFKPLRHYLKSTPPPDGQSSLFSIWKSILSVLEEFLGSGRQTDQQEGFAIPARIKNTMDSLANEHLQNSIIFLLSLGVIQNNKSSEMNSFTWDSVERMGYSEKSVREWIEAATSN